MSSTPSGIPRTLGHDALIVPADGVLLETLGVALHALDLAKPRLGETVAVLGCGPVGLLIVQLARVAKAHLAGPAALAVGIGQGRQPLAQQPQHEGDRLGSLLLDQLGQVRALDQLHGVPDQAVPPADDHRVDLQG